MAFVYVKEMEPTIYTEIKEDLWNGFLKVKNNDPKKITDSYQQ